MSIFGIKPWTKNFILDSVEKQYNNTYPIGKLEGISINNFQDINKMRKASIIHKQVRYHIQKDLKPGCDLFEIVKKIEEITKILSNNEGLNGGIGFPCGVSVDNCAAHFSPTSKMIMNDKSIYKIDFGTHVDGYIIDSAFSISFNPVMEELLLASKEATEIGISHAGVDQNLGDWGDVVQEVMESHEITIDGKNYEIKPVRNLGGHNINKYKIHGGQLLLGIKNESQEKMKSNTMYAIETFATTGNGFAFHNEDENNLYALHDIPNYNLKFDCSKKVLKEIKNKYSTLPIVDRWFDHIPNYKIGIKELATKGLLYRYPPLYDIKNSYISQYEHTIFLTDNGREILSLGDDY